MLNQSKYLTIKKIRNLLLPETSLKVNIRFYCSFIRQKVEEFNFIIRLEVILRLTKLKEYYQTEIRESEWKQSGWHSNSINYVELCIHIHNPIRDSSYVDLPESS